MKMAMRTFLSRKSGFSLAVALALAFLPLAPAAAQKSPEPEWTQEELALIATLTIDKLLPPPDPSNRYADDARAADFGHRLFFDLRLSSNGQVGCVTCHDPSKSFTDGKRFSQGVGVTPRNAPTTIGSAWNLWFLWDGRADNHWSQSLAAIENPLEHNLPRREAVRVLRDHEDLRKDYESIFGALPALEDADGVNRAFANIGKALAAYQRHLRPGASKFDRYAQAILNDREPAPADRLTLDEREGLHVFLSDQRGKCMRCHNGPLFTNHHFHNIGVTGRQGAEHETGRLKGIETARASEFNCAGRYSDAKPEQCLELNYARRATPDLLGAFKTPTLRNLIKTAPYMRDSSQPTIDDVTWHYRDRPAARTGVSELENFTITGVEFEQLDAFLRTLEGGVDAPERYLKPPGK